MGAATVLAANCELAGIPAPPYLCAAALACSKIVELRAAGPRALAISIDLDAVAVELDTAIKAAAVQTKYTSSGRSSLLSTEPNLPAEQA